MNKCNYIIHIPGGGKIEIPADFGSISHQSVDFLEAYNKWTETLIVAGETIKESNESNDALNQLVDQIEKESNLQGLNKFIIKDILNQDLDLKSKVDTINEYLESQTNYKDFRKALRNYLRKNPGEFEKINKKISNRLTPTTFRNYPVGKYLGQTDLRTEQKNLQKRISYSGSERFDTHYLQNIDKFIDLVIANQWMDLNKQTLMSFSPEFGSQSANIDEYSFFKEGDFNSLFMSIFKKVAGNNINTQELNKLLSEYKLKADYTDSRDFFKNDFEEDILLSPFEELLRNKTNNNLINKIINLLGNSSSEKNRNTLIATVKYIIQNLNPDTYGLDALREAQAAQRLLNAEKIFNAEHREEYQTNIAQQKGAFRILDNEIELDKESMEIITSNDTGDKINQDLFTLRDDNYSEMIKLDSINYDYVIENVNVGEDLVMLPFTSKNSKTGEEKTHYNPMLVKKIYPRNRGVNMQLKYRTSAGNYEIRSIYFDVNGSYSDIFIRKPEKAKIKYSESHKEVFNNDLANFTVDHKVFSKNDAQKFIKENATIGDETNFGKIVGVYPSYLLIQDKKTENLKKVKYSQISNFRSSVLNTIGLNADSIISNINHNAYSPVNDVNIISEGDLVIDPNSISKKDVYLPVVYTNKDYVFVLASSADPDKPKTRNVLAISKESIANHKMKNPNHAKALLHSYASLTKLELESLNTNINIISDKSLSNATMSSFTNINKAQSGDYFMAIVNDIEIRGKLLDSNTGKAIYYSQEGIKPININSLSNPVFYTEREIRSDFAISTIRMNNWRIKPYYPSDADSNKKLKEVRYVIPEHITESSLEMLPDGYATIGRYQDLSAPIPKGYKDVTKYILSNFYNEQEGVKLYAEIQFGTKYFRNTTGTQLIAKFNELSAEIKEKADVLKPGVYFSVIGNGDQGHRIYRIEQDNGDTVTAHYNKINSQGKIITVEKVFNKSDLLKSKEGDITPDGSIFSLYLQNNNRKMNLLINEVNKMTNDSSEFANSLELMEFRSKMQESFNPYGIDVIIDNSGEGFENNQNAKIHTDIIDGELKTSIVLNGLRGTKADLIHENLHILFAMLRHQDPTAYGKTIEAILGERASNMTVGVREERAINHIINSLNNNFSMDFLFDSGYNVMEDLFKVVNIIFNRHSSDVKIKLGDLIDISSLETNPYDFFNTKISDIVGIKDNTDSPYFNARLVDSETAFINWMDDNNIILKCN